MMEIAAYDGTTNGDTIKEYGDWFRQFGTIVTSKTGTTSPIGATADYKPLADSLLNSGVIPIMVLHSEYHKFISDSITLSSLITYQNNQLNDVPGRTSSPYELHEIVSFSPKQNKFYDKLSHDFRINADFIRTNVSKTISTFKIDFDNGSGYQTITLGSNSKITWSSFGKKVLKLRVTYTDSSVYHAKAQIDLVDKSGGQPKYNSTRDETVYIPHPTIANHGVELAIAYGCGNNELRKPFIFVEGFNPELFGNDNYEEDFFDDFNDYQNDWTPPGFPILSELDENGYDVVYVDFDRGDGSLIENAKALQAAINWINEEKAANCSTSDNILVGYSMGGVVARLALTYMEDDAEDHEVSYYVSVDSPHRGANVPRSLIAALIDIYTYQFGTFNISEDVPALEGTFQVVNSPAAKQMLIYSGEGSNTLVTGSGPTHIAFQNHLDAQGMPTQTLQNIAVAKGGGIGIGQFGSAVPFVNVDISTFSGLGCLSDEVPDAVGWLAGIYAFLKLGIYAKVVLDLNAMPGYVNYDLRIYTRKVKLAFKISSNGSIAIGWDKHETDAKTVNSFDGVQGGTYEATSFTGLDNPDIEEFINDLIEGEFEPCAALHQPVFTFIPTVSALNLSNYMGGPNGGSPNVQIDPVAIVSNNQTSFDKAFILDPTKYPSDVVAPSNESHLDLTPSNLFPFSSIIPPDFNAVNENATVHGYTFNFGSAVVSGDLIETTDRIVHPLTVSGLISANGALWINGDDNLEDRNDPNNPLSTSDHFSVQLTTDCNGSYGRVTVESLGSIVIGEDIDKTGEVFVRNDCWIKMNDGFLEVRNGSKLIIDDGAELRLNGGLLRIQDGGEVIIKDGGKLIYEDGAQIELNGHDAVLSLGGRTHIGDDATFTFTYQGTESGYIRMLEEGFSEERFSAGSNAEVRLQGENEDDLILYLEEDVDFWEFDGAVPGESYSSEMFDYVQFKDGKVVISNRARIVLPNNSRFIRCKVDAYGSSYYRGRIVPYTFCDISGCTLNNITVDAKLNSPDPDYLYITNSELNNSLVSVRGYGYKVRSSEFNNSSINAKQNTMTNSVIYTTFDGANTAILESLNTDLYVYKSEFRNHQNAILVDISSATFKCNTFEYNETAIYGWKESTVNLSTLYNGGYNYFDNNDYNIKFHQAYELLMEDGYNEFYDGDIMNVLGTFYFSGYPCPPAINAHNNTWTPLSNNNVPNSDPNHPDAAEFDLSMGYQPGGGPWQVYCQIGFDFGPVAPITRCGEYDDPKEPNPGDDGPKSNDFEEEFPLVSTPTYFTNKPFDYAVKVAAYSTSIADSANGNDMIAADKYYELLHLAVMDSVPSDSLSLVIENMRWNCLNNYKNTIQRLFTDSILLRSNNQNTFEPAVQNYVEVLMDFTDSVKTAENYKQQFQLELWKSSLLRTIGKKEMSLQLLSNINYCDHDSLKKVVLLELIQNLEYDLLVSQMEDYVGDSVTFVLDSSIYHIPLESYIDTSGFGSYIMSPNSILYSSCNTFLAKSASTDSNISSDVGLYPNPAQDFLNVSILNDDISSEDILTIRVFEMTGRQIFTSRLKAQNVRIDLPDLANALYIYHIELNDKIIDQGKIAITK